MKNLKFLLAVFSLAMLVALPVKASEQKNWQVYSRKTDTLIVHEGAYSDSPVCYIGKNEDYNGHCSTPSRPTDAYKVKLSEK